MGLLEPLLFGTCTELGALVRVVNEELLRWIEAADGTLQLWCVTSSKNRR